MQLIYKGGTIVLDWLSIIGPRINLVVFGQGALGFQQTGDESLFCYFSALPVISFVCPII